MRIGRVGTPGLLLVITLAALLGAKSAADKPAAPPGGGPQEAEVTGVFVEPQSRQPFMALQGKRDKRTVVLVIAPLEAERIAMLLQDVTTPRPLTHDLILSVLAEVKASLARIVITDLRNDTYYAVLHLEVGGQSRRVDSRPTDAVALALRAKVPILVEDRVFDKAERAMPKSGPSPHF
jgi:bifunctional DNase/RNase